MDPKHPTYPAVPAAAAAAAAADSPAGSAFQEAFEGLQADFALQRSAGLAVPEVRCRSPFHAPAGDALLG